MVITSKKKLASTKSSQASTVEKKTTTTTVESKTVKNIVPKMTAQKTSNEVSADQRLHMIATAAYYLAERRGFVCGYEMQDWISAEGEIDKHLQS